MATVIKSSALVETLWKIILYGEVSQTTQNNVEKKLHNVKIVSVIRNKFQFDSSKKGQNIILSAGQHQATQKGSRANYATALGKTDMQKGMIHTFSIKCVTLKNSNIYFGVVWPLTMKLNYDTCFFETGWGFRTNVGKCNNSETGKYGHEVKEGDIVTTIFDRIEGTLAFSINGEYQGIAY